MSTSVAVMNIGELVTNSPELGDGSLLGLVRSAALVVDSGRIAWVGEQSAAPAADSAIDAAASAVIPGFVDSHSHLVFAGDRSAEFAARMAGEPYSAGGISTTVDATRQASDSVLLDNVGRLVAEMHAQGTTTVEIKSGYGLTVADETRSLAVASHFTDDTTFLGAHVVPPEFSQDPAAYVDLVTGSMLSGAAPYARWVDVFCDDGAFDADQARAILRAGTAAGLQPRIHANQLRHGLGVTIACEFAAASADHCTFLTDGDVDNLRTAGVVATLLPGAEFSTRSPYPDARRLRDAGVTVALATDCNPGTSYTTSMQLCIALAVREMHMTAAEAMWAATAGGAAALRRPEVGRLAVGCSADFTLLRAPSYVHLAYRPGVPLVGEVYRRGLRIA